MGKVINRFGYTTQLVETTDKASDLSHAAWVVVEHHYRSVSNPGEIPEEVEFSVSLPDSSECAKFFSDLRKKRVRLIQRSKSDLMVMAMRNAQVEADAVDHQHNEVEASLGDLLRTLALVELENVQELLNKETPPKMKRLRRIEAFDVSHTAGTGTVAASAVLIDGKPDLRQYRKFRLSGLESTTPGSPNDYASLQEALRARFAQSADVVEEMPDLVLIDGGKGQLSAAMKVFVELRINFMRDVWLCSIAKSEESVFLPGMSNPVNNSVTPGVRLLCLARDEAHRHALQSHRKLRGREALRSTLNAIPGLGKEKRERLLLHFNDSPEAIKSASMDQLQCVPGIGPGLAQRIQLNLRDENRE